jgi:general secretion pathway protein C
MSSTAYALALALPAPLRHPALWSRLALAAAGVLLAIALARLAWLLLAGPVLPLDAATPLPAPSAAASQAPVGSIAQWHLFGDAMPLTRQAAVAPETQLKLFLRGTLNTDADGEGIAIIADAEGGERAYRAGDALPGGATLTEVHAGRVLLSRDGITEQLSLPLDPGAGGAPATTAARAPGGSSVIGPGMRPGALSLINPGISRAGPQIEAATRAALPDLAALASQVQVFPVLENGRFAGVRIAAGRDSDLLSRTGIRPTDIVTAVNGIPLDGPQRQQQLVESLSGGGPVQVTVLRDGKPLQLSVSLR